MQDFQNMAQNGIQHSNIEEFVNNPIVRKARALMDLVKGLMAVGICSYVLFFTPFFDRLSETEDDIAQVFAKGMKVLLVLFIVMGFLMFIRSLVVLILLQTGNDGTGAGRRFIVIVGAMQANAGRVFQMVFGGIFVAFSFFAFTQGPDMLAEGTTVESLYIVSGIFTLAGLGLIIGAIIGIVKNVKYYLSGAAD